MKLEQQELDLIKGMHDEFVKLKITLGDLELAKSQAINQIMELKKNFDQHELKLVDKYGADSVINMQTGDVTKKEE